MKLRATESAVILVATVLAACPPAEAFHHTTARRWMQRDPAGYVDGPNRYEHVKSRPSTLRDSSGLAANDECPDCRCPGRITIKERWLPT